MKKVMQNGAKCSLRFAANWRGALFDKLYWRGIRCIKSFFEKRKRLFAGRLPANSELFARKLPANSELFAGRLPVNNELFAGRHPANYK